MRKSSLAKLSLILAISVILCIHYILNFAIDNKSLDKDSLNKDLDIADICEDKSSSVVTPKRKVINYLGFYILLKIWYRI